MRLFAPFRSRPATPALPPPLVPAFTLRVAYRQAKDTSVWGAHADLCALIDKQRVHAVVASAEPRQSYLAPGMGTTHEHTLLPEGAMPDGRTCRAPNASDLPGDVIAAVRAASGAMTEIINHPDCAHTSQHLHIVQFRHGLLLADRQGFFAALEGQFFPLMHHADPRLTGPDAPGNPLLILAPGSGHTALAAVREAPHTLGAIFPHLTLAHHLGTQRIPLSFAIGPAEGP